MSYLIGYREKIDCVAIKQGFVFKSEDKRMNNMAIPTEFYNIEDGSEFTVKGKYNPVIEKIYIEELTNKDKGE